MEVRERNVDIGDEDWDAEKRVQLHSCVSRLQCVDDAGGSKEESASRCSGSENNTKTRRKVPPVPQRGK
jgi:hypothetical protein